MTPLRHETILALYPRWLSELVDAASASKCTKMMHVKLETTPLTAMVEQAAAHRPDKQVHQDNAYEAGDHPSNRNG